MPGVNAPNVAGAPSVSASVAGTVPPTPPVVQGVMLATSPLSTRTLVEPSTVPSAAVQVSV